MTEVPRAPSRSILYATAPRVIGSTRQASAAAMMPIGTLTRKMARQPRPSTFQSSSSPPSTWPETPPTPTVRPNQDSALARSSRGNVAWMTASTWGTISEAVAPWISRAMTSSAAELATPQSREAAAKASMPATNSVRWPYRSPSRPPVTSPAA